MGEADPIVLQVSETKTRKEKRFVRLFMFFPDPLSTMKYVVFYHYGTWNSPFFAIQRFIR